VIDETDFALDGPRESSALALDLVARVLQTSCIAVNNVVELT